MVLRVPDGTPASDANRAQQSFFDPLRHPLFLHRDYVDSRHPTRLECLLLHDLDRANQCQALCLLVFRHEIETRLRRAN